VGPLRLVVPGPAGLRGRHAPGQERAREPAMARGGGRRAGVLARRAGFQGPALIDLHMRLFSFAHPSLATLPAQN
jgi:hypothetical protein